MALTLRRPDTRNQITNADSREERKYPFPPARASLLTAWLDARLPRDPQYSVGVVTSCYYDTPQLDAYQESADGELRKQKLRLRWYGDPIDRYAGVWLEIKSRDGVRSYKQRHRYAISGAANALDLVIPRREELAAWLSERSVSIGAPLDPTLVPTAFVRYRRIRWQSSDRHVRAALDTEVRTAAPSGAPIWLPIPDGAVLELKSAGELPAQLAHLERLGLRRTAHSKYALAVETLYGGESARVG